MNAKALERAIIIDGDRVERDQPRSSALGVLMKVT